MDLHTGNIFVHQKSGPGEVPKPYIGDFETSNTFDRVMVDQTKQATVLPWFDSLVLEPCYNLFIRYRR